MLNSSDKKVKRGLCAIVARYNLMELVIHVISSNNVVTNQIDKLLDELQYGLALDLFAKFYALLDRDILICTKIHPCEKIKR